VRQLAHDHAISPLPPGDLGHRAPKLGGLGAQTGGLGHSDGKKARTCRAEVAHVSQPPERGRNGVTIAQDRQRPQIAKNGPECQSGARLAHPKGKTQQRWAPGSVSPLRGRPLAKARCFQGPGTAPRPWPPTAILIRTVPALIPGRASPRSNCGMSRFCGGRGSGGQPFATWGSASINAVGHHP
jgi:hypothetical protein